MHPVDIKAALEKRGVTLTEVGKRLGVRRCTVSMVVARRGASKRIQTLIAEIIGKPYEEVWSAPRVGWVPMAEG